jgi:polypeptide N-acetylgalactosaminyltransferase
MLGCAFAIRKDFFADLGQNDEGLKIWNGEQIELSLKLHLCGGDLLEVPCSRASHIFRSNTNHHELNGVDFAARNFKRVKIVYKEF